MKKVFCYLFVIISLLTFVSCGSSSSQEAETPVPKNYKEACEINDWLAAYEFCEQIKNEAESMTDDVELAAKNASDKYADYREAKESFFTPKSTSEKLYEEYKGLKEIAVSKAQQKEDKQQQYVDAVNYVVLQEATSVLESQRIEGLSKISFIVKEHNASWLYRDLIDIAIALGDGDLESQLKKDAGVSDNTAEYKNACEEGDYKTAYLIVSELKNDVQNYANSYSSAIQYGTEEYKKYNYLREKYEESERYVVRHQVTGILENKGKAGLPSIAKIVKEYNAKWVYHDLIDIAVAMGDDKLEARLRKLAN